MLAVDVDLIAEFKSRASVSETSVMRPHWHQLALLAAMTLAGPTFGDALPLAPDGVRSKGPAEVAYRDGRVRLALEKPGNEAGVRVTPPPGESGGWDLSRWKILAVDVTNLSDTTQMRLLMRVQSGQDQGDKDQVEVGIALNPGEERTMRLTLPHYWKYAAPEGPRGPRTLDTRNVTELAFFVQWPFERAKADLVNCELSNFRVEEPLTPTEPMTAEQFFPFIDEYGQFVHAEWPEKIHSVDDLRSNYEREKAELSRAERPAQWNSYGGWKNGPQLEATGHFRTQKNEGKWWLVDPEGRLFWSHGLDVLSNYNDAMRVKGRESWFVAPPQGQETFQPTEVCLQLKYGREDYHSEYYRNLNQRLEAWGFNSIGNWAKSELIELGRTPYTLQLTDYNWSWPRIKNSKLKFYDVWDQRYIDGMKSLIADQIEKRPVVRKSLTDPMCIGYFIDNELDFGNRNGKLSLVGDILRSPAEQPAKQELVRDLKGKYDSIAPLNAAWGTQHTDWDALLAATDVPDTAEYRNDAHAFYLRCVDQYFKLARDAVKSVAPHRLYLGSRFVGTDSIQRELYEATAKYADVLTVNIYAHNVANYPVENFPDMPVLIGEFHFGVSGAEGRGMFHPSLCRAGVTQKDRAIAYTRFLQGALVHPNIVGTHWFQYRDQPLTGRGDGEAYQIGFVDVQDTPYRELCDAARTIGENLYAFREAGRLMDRP